MFDLFSGQHILILLVVMLVVIGPKDLPRMMHMAGQWAGKARRMANEFKKSFDDMARQEELDKLRLELDELRKVQINVPDMNIPLGDVEVPPIEAATAPSGEFHNEAPRSGEYQINETPAAPSAPAPSTPVTAPAGGIETLTP